MSEQILIECTSEQARKWREFCAAHNGLSPVQILLWLLENQAATHTANAVIDTTITCGVDEFLGFRGRYEREWSPPEPA